MRNISLSQTNWLTERKTHIFFHSPSILYPPASRRHRKSYQRKHGYSPSFWYIPKHITYSTMRGVHTTSCALFIDVLDEECDVMMDQILAAFQKKRSPLRHFEADPNQANGYCPPLLNLRGHTNSEQFLCSHNPYDRLVNH